MADLVLLAPQLAEQAEQLAAGYGFKLVSQLPTSDDYFLCLDQDGLSLKQGSHPKTSVQVDFVGGSNAHRRKFGGGLGQDIAKAVGVSSVYQPTVVDATAGLGRDAFVLASLGCQVLAYERNPVVAALLADGLERAKQDFETAQITSRIQLHYGLSHAYLQPLPELEKPDVVYLDPMFAHDEKQTALVKKDMQAFHSVVGQDDDADELLAKALAHARCRVVVKRARKALPLANQKPSYSLIGKANRFDVYALAKVEPRL